PGDLLAVDLHAAGHLRHDAHQGLEQRGLAHAVAAHDRDDFLLVDLQLEVVKDLALAVAGGEIADLEHAELLFCACWATRVDMPAAMSTLRCAGQPSA